jgi:hypothetical protein
MRGFAWTNERATLRRSVAEGGQLKMLAAPLAVGVIAGLLVAHVRLNLGLPGHKALLWLPPIIVARMLGRCRIGDTAGSAATACTTFALGGNLAGGRLGLPLLVVAGIFLDLVISSLESRNAPARLYVPIIAIAAMLANLICLGKRLLLPAGLGAHLLFNASSLRFRLCSYALFGLAAGLIAGVTACFIERRRRYRLD